MSKEDLIDETDPVMRVFERFGEARRNIRGDRVAAIIQDRIIEALAPEFGIDRAWQIAFHLSDWNWEFAFLTALHLSPESFTDEEIREGIEALTIHGVNHLMAATHLAGRQLLDFHDLGLQITK